MCTTGPHWHLKYLLFQSIKFDIKDYTDMVEVYIIRFRHKNLVELMGYCPKPVCLIYEYMEIGSLYKCLHDQVCYVSNSNY